ncbi:MAG: hypothetical protein H7A38_03180 [Chlamydiales bacterium]|nr:hypothetical protein [Chlamydiales bacterium]
MEEVSGLRRRMPTEAIGENPPQQSSWTLTSREGWKLQLIEQGPAVIFKLFNPKGEEVDYRAQFFKAPTFFKDPIVDVTVVLQEIKQLANTPNQGWGFWVSVTEDTKTKEKKHYVVFGDRWAVTVERVQGYAGGTLALAVAGACAFRNDPKWLVGGLLGLGGGLLGYLRSTPGESYHRGSALKETAISSVGSILGGHVAQAIPVKSLWATTIRNLGSSLSIQCAGSLVREGKMPLLNDLKVSVITGMGGSFFEQAVSHSLNQSVKTVSQRILASVLAGMGGSAFSTTTSNLWREKNWSENMIFSVLLGGYSSGVHDVHKMMEDQAKIAQSEQAVTTREKTLIEKAEKEFGKIVDEKLAEGLLPDDPTLKDRETILRALSQGKEVTFMKNVEKEFGKIVDEKLAGGLLPDDPTLKDREAILKALEQGKKVTFKKDIEKEFGKIVDEKLAEGLLPDDPALQNREAILRALEQGKKVTFKSDIEKEFGKIVDEKLAEGLLPDDPALKDRGAILRALEQGEEVTFKSNQDRKAILKALEQGEEVTFKRGDVKLSSAAFGKEWEEIHQARSDLENQKIALDAALQQEENTVDALRLNRDELTKKWKDYVEKLWGTSIDNMIKDGWKLKKHPMDREWILHQIAQGQALTFHLGKKKAMIHDPTVQNTYHAANCAATTYDAAHQIYVSHKTKFEGIDAALKPSYDRIKEREETLRKEVENRFGAKVDELIKTHSLKDKNIDRNRNAIIGELMKGEALHFHGIGSKDVILQHLRFKEEFWAIQREKEKIELLKAYVLFEDKVCNLTPEQAEKIRQDIQATEQERTRSIEEAEKKYGNEIDQYLSNPKVLLSAGDAAYLDGDSRCFLPKDKNSAREILLKILAQGKSLRLVGGGIRDTIIFSGVKSWGWTPETSERLTENYALIVAYDRMFAHNSSEMLNGIHWRDFSPEGLKEMLSRIWRGHLEKEEKLRSAIKEKYQGSIESLFQKGYTNGYKQPSVYLVIGSLINNGSIELYKLGADGKRDPTVPSIILEIPEFSDQRQSLQIDRELYNTFNHTARLPRSSNQGDRLVNLHQQSFDLQRATDPKDIVVLAATFELGKKMYEHDFGLANNPN